MSRVLVVGDTHMPGMRDDYIEFLLHIADSWSIDRVVHIGDMVDWHSLSYHEKRPTLPTPATEYMEMREQMAQFFEAFPAGDWLIGNHDDLPQRQCITSMIPPELLKSYEAMFDTPPGWTVHPRFTKLEIDGVLYCHGDGGAGGKYAHINQAERNFQSTVVGHFHALGGVEFLANEKHRIFGCATGCGVDYRKEQFHYGKRYPKKPVNGCAVVLEGLHPYFEPMILGK